VPVADIRQIDFSTRIPPDVAKRIDKAVADLGSDEHKTREDASAELLKLREKSYPALLEAAKHHDREVRRRADELLDKLRQTVPEDQLTVRKADVIQAGEMTLVGRIEAVSWKVNTTQFGDVEVKLADIRSLRAGNGETSVVANALP